MIIKEGYCHCGCGQLAPIAKRTDTHAGCIKGKPRKYIIGHNSRGKKGESSPKWKGGRRRKQTPAGYVIIHKPGHPRANKIGYVFEHIIVMENLLGRPIEITEAIHHINEDKSDNSPGNLMVFKTRTMHTKYHKRLEAFAACGHYDWLKCCYCHQYDDPKNLKRNHHKQCEQKRCRENYLRKKNQPVDAGF